MHAPLPRGWKSTEAVLIRAHGIAQQGRASSADGLGCTVAVFGAAVLAELELGLDALDHDLDADDVGQHGVQIIRRRILDLPRACSLGQGRLGASRRTVPCTCTTR